MFKKRYFPAALIMLLAACNSGPRQPSVTDSTTVHVTNSPVGSYQGTIPCADCPGIDYQVSLFDDHQYKTLMVYRGRDNNRAFVEAGAWKTEGDSIISLQGKQPAKFMFTDGKLYQLDQSGKRITGALADNYILRRVEGGSNRASLREKAKAGVVFTAGGNEPFWTLELNRKRQLLFRALNGDSLQASFPAARPNTDSLKVYTTGKITLKIRASACNDNMSGFLHAYTVEVQLKDKTYRGCGEYLDNESLRSEK